MSWLSKVRNGIASLTKKQSSENLWHKCKKCQTMIFTKEWEENYNVCPRCDYHDRIGPQVALRSSFSTPPSTRFCPRPRSRKTRSSSAIPSATPTG